MSYDKAFWIKVIEFILWLLTTGKRPDEAVDAASKKFGVSASEIWGHGGF